MEVAQGVCPTYATGTTLDYVAPNCRTSVEVLPREAGAMRTDHHGLCVRLPGEAGKLLTEPAYLVG